MGEVVWFKESIVSLAIEQRSLSKIMDIVRAQIRDAWIDEGSIEEILRSDEMHLVLGNIPSLLLSDIEVDVFCSSVEDAIDDFTKKFSTI